uniref:Uncharacterized protein n=1 Tax=Triticum urartu TaxID=4572 RepID=A0A8R7R2I5_TRIUA
MIRCKQQAKVDIPFHARLRTRTRPRLVVSRNFTKLRCTTQYSPPHIKVTAAAHTGQAAAAAPIIIIIQEKQSKKKAFRKQRTNRADDDSTIAVATAEGGRDSGLRAP